MGKLIGIAVGLWLWAGVFYTLETLRPGRKQPRWREDSKTDVAYFFFTGVVTRPIATAAAAALLLEVTKGPCAAERGFSRVLATARERKRSADTSSARPSPPSACSSSRAASSAWC